MKRHVRWVLVLGFILSVWQAFAQVGRFQDLAFGLKAPSSGFAFKRVLLGPLHPDTGNNPYAEFQLKYAWDLGPQRVLGSGLPTEPAPLKWGTLSATAPTQMADAETHYGLPGYGQGVGLRVTDRTGFFQTAYDLDRYDEIVTNVTLTLQSATTLFSLGASYRF